MTLPRVDASKGKRRGRRVDYYHVIGALKKKPMAFYRSELRDDLLPTPVYRQIWRLLDARVSDRAACKLMVGALALAAKQDCEPALGQYLLQALQGRRAAHPGRTPAALWRAARSPTVLRPRAACELLRACGYSPIRNFRRAGSAEPVIRNFRATSIDPVQNPSKDCKTRLSFWRFRRRCGTHLPVHALAVGLLCAQQPARQHR
ncbi:MAG: hypothetical protein WA970_06890, partial [Gammaproteobacteria bacterium]